jgi:Flp pilus assembly protein TadD
MNRRPKNIHPNSPPTILRTKADPKNRWTDWILAAALIAVTFLSYQPAWNGGPLLDDSDRFLKTPEQRSLNGLVQLWIQPRTSRQYHPVIDTVYWIEDKLWADNVLGYHLVTIALHVAAALLLVNILRKLEIPGAWFAAAVFALHPVQVESVAWMVEIKNTLSGLFFLAAVLAYLNFDERRTSRAYFLVLLLFIFGILTKAIVATLPLVALILIWWKRRRINWSRDVQPLLPFVAAAIVAASLTAWMERAFSGAEGEEYGLSILDRLLIAGRAFWFYIGKLFLPINLSLIYPRWKIDSSAWWQYLFPIAMLAVVVVAWFQRKRWAWLFAALIFFAVTVAPLLGFFNVSFYRLSFVADHFQYLPSLGIIVLVASGAAVGLRAIDGWQLATGRAACGALLISLAALSWNQSHMYRDNETCYRMVLEKNPTSWTAHYNVGSELMQRGQIENAEVEFNKVLELEPTNPLAEREARNGLGGTAAAKGNLDAAIAEFQRSVQIYPRDAQGHNGIAAILHRQGHLAEAIAEYELTAELRPNSASVLSNFAWMLATCANASLRDGPRAVTLAERANTIARGGDAKVLRSLAAAYAEVGRFPEAAKAGQRALQLSIVDGRAPFRDALRHEIALFEASQPYHERPR